jgi:hypothetical protein
MKLGLPQVRLVDDGGSERTSVLKIVIGSGSGSGSVCGFGDVCGFSAICSGG